MKKYILNPISMEHQQRLQNYVNSGIIVYIIRSYANYNKIAEWQILKNNCQEDEKMQYKVVLDKALILPAVVERVEMNVQKMCDEGWQPQGSIYIFSDGEYICACQAMVK